MSAWTKNRAPLDFPDAFSRGRFAIDDATWISVLRRTEIAKAAGGGREHLWGKFPQQPL
jgi:hypothetical protein